MTRLRATISGLAALALCAPSIAGQQPGQPNVPRVGFVYPAGGQQGTRVQATIGGQFFGGATAVYVSGTGIEARILSLDRPLTQRQIMALREQLQAAQKLPASPAAASEMAAVRQKIADSLRRNQQPALSERLVVALDISGHVEPGSRTVRVLTPQGLSNPVIFDVDRVAEWTEPADAPDASQIHLPAIVNGRLIPRAPDTARPGGRGNAQVLEGDVDRYRFHARRGQSLVAAVRARDLQPFIADAVPGWFQATIALHDESGREVAFSDDTAIRPDPVLHYVVPRDGSYTLEVRDALFRGRDDFVYRIAIGELPYVTSVFPLGVQAGSSVPVDLRGWNLPAPRERFDAAARAPGVYAWMPAGGSSFNSRAVAVGVLPELTEREPNDSVSGATTVRLPVTINGRVERPDDWDLFQFRGRAGQRVALEVVARSLGSPLDSLLELLDARGERLEFNDDCKGPLWGDLTHQADSIILATLPNDGTFVVRIGDAALKGGPEHAYRLRISEPQPDFDVRVAPSAINAGAGGTVPITVAVVRKDGFEGDVSLSLIDAPAGVILSGGLVPGGVDQVQATVTLAPAAGRGLRALQFEARASINGRTAVRRPAAADVRMQAFASQHFVPSNDSVLATSGRGALRAPARVTTPLPLRIPSGGAATLRVSLPAGYQTLEGIVFELRDPPEGVSIGQVRIAARVAQIEVRADPGAAAPLRGNLIIGVSGERAGAAPQGTSPVRRRQSLGVLPAVPFEILRR